jgi:cytochrome c553
MKIAGVAAALAAVFSTAGQAADLDGSAFPRRGLQAKMQYCKDCHGVSGSGYRGYIPIPRLAGQTSTYIENQITAFAERRRKSIIPLKLSIVHGLTPPMRTALAARFEDLDSKPVGGAPIRFWGTGKKIFEEGIPEANIPACSACHGPQAMGDGPNPRLAGQLYAYIVEELMNWTGERAQNAAEDDPSAVMAPIAQNLSKSQIEAVASYLSALK